MDVRSLMPRIDALYCEPRLTPNANASRFERVGRQTKSYCIHQVAPL